MVAPAFFHEGTLNMGFDVNDPRLNVVVGVAGAGKTSLAMDLLEQHLRDGLAWHQIGFLSFSRAACAEAVKRAAKICDEPESRLTEVGWFKTLHGAVFRCLGADPKSILDPEAKDTQEWYEQTLGIKRGGDRGTLGWKVAGILDRWDLARHQLWPLLEESSTGVGGNAGVQESGSQPDGPDRPDGRGRGADGGVSARFTCVFTGPDARADGVDLYMHEMDSDKKPTFARRYPVRVSAQCSSRVKRLGFGADGGVSGARPVCPRRTGDLLYRCSEEGWVNEKDAVYLREIIQKYEAGKLLWGKQDFTDILLKFAGYRATDLRIQPTHPAGTPADDVLVWFLDEAQDCSALLWAAANRLTERAETVHILGDPFQAVYRFIGAEPDTLLGLAVGSRQRGSYTLMARSWRNPAEVLDWGERVLTEDPAYQQRQPFSEKEEGSVGLVRWEDFSRRIGELATVDTMILARTWFSIARVQAMLNERGIPWSSASDKQTSRWDCPAKIGLLLTIRELLAGQRISEQDWRRCIDHFPQKLAGVELFRRGEKARWKKIACSHEPELTLAEVDRWGATPAFVEHLRSGEWKTDMLMLLDAAIEKYGIDTVRSPKIRLGTCHSVKGMEARVVYCIASSTDASAAADPTEERNLRYVTITRAIQHYRLVVDMQDVARGKPLFWAAPKGFRTYDTEQRFIESERIRNSGGDPADAPEPWDLLREDPPDGAQSEGDTGHPMLLQGQVHRPGGEDGHGQDHGTAGQGTPDDHEEWWDL